MQRSASILKLSCAGWTLAELTVALAVSSLLCGGLLTGAISLQKSFIASRHHVIAQAEQMRLIDYMNLDLRRALSVSTNTDRLTVTIPDYYDSFDEPRNPEIRYGLAAYGPSPKVISYYKQGSTIFRTEGATTTAICTDVADFQMTFKDLGQSIQVAVTFVPKFQFTTKNRASVRDGTATFTTTLLRNKRQS